MYSFAKCDERNEMCLLSTWGQGERKDSLIINKRSSTVSPETAELFGRNNRTFVFVETSSGDDRTFTVLSALVF